MRPGTDEEKRQAVVEEWYREQLKNAVPPLLERWQPRLGVQVEPAECLEYIVVHELVHLLEPTHNARFLALMDQFMPKWQLHRQVLNRLPVRQEKWSY